MNIREIKEIVQSSHLNFLVGAGCSTPFLGLLGDIENKLNRETRDSERIKIKKEYFRKIMLPNLDLVESKLSSRKKSDFQKTNKSYKEFFESLGRKSLDQIAKLQN